MQQLAQQHVQLHEPGLADPWALQKSAVSCHAGQRGSVGNKSQAKRDHRIWWPTKKDCTNSNQHEYFTIADAKHCHASCFCCW